MKIVLVRAIPTVIVTLGLCIMAVEAGRALWFGSGSEPNQAFTDLTTPPRWTIEDPRANGYFLLLGFASSPALDPIEVGYQLWNEADSRTGRRFFDYNKPGRAHLAVDEEPPRTLDAWGCSDATAEFKRRAETLAAATRHALLLERYERWLSLRFEDRGYGLSDSPRFVEIMAAHRLYVAAGFAAGLRTGIARLERDLAAWRAVLAHATTLPTKIAAAVAVEDGAVLLSSLPHRPELEASAVARLRRLARPLESGERSLRWPIQSEFTMAVNRHVEPQPVASPIGKDSGAAKRWLAAVSGLPLDAFEQVERARSFGALARAPVRRQKTLNTYARYYQALIRASESPPGLQPRLRDAASSARRGLAETLLSPIETASLEEPQWESHLLRLAETDARLRLTTLKATLLATASRQPIPVRVAQAGSVLFDPFTGLPMLWNPEKGILYSVGKDRRDDDGDASLDIAIPIPLSGRLPHSCN